MKKAVKKMNENELALISAIIDIGPFEGYIAMLEKGDVKPPVSFSDNDWWDEDDNWSIPMKDMKRMERRKATIRKKEARQTVARDLGYNLSPNMTSGKVKTLLSASHADRMYFRGAKAQKMGKPMTTKDALNMMAQIEREAEEDRETERKEAERQFMLDELASTTDDLQRLEFVEMEAKKAVAELIRTIYEANGKLVDYQAKINGLKAAEEVLRKKISKLEEAVNS